MGGKILSDIEAVGLKFGILTVVSRHGTDSRNHTLWLCECECGKTTTAEMDTMRSGRKKSCGCLRSSSSIYRFTKHGATLSDAPAELRRTFEIWVSMRKRCNNKNDRAYKWYGARGIYVCPEWDEFKVFLSDMGLIASPLTLERLNVDGPYCKENCTLIPLKDQACNRTTTIWVPYGGVQWCLKSLCKYLSIPYIRTWKRLYNSGWTLERALQP